MIIVHRWKIWSVSYIEMQDQEMALSHAWSWHWKQDHLWESTFRQHNSFGHRIKRSIIFVSYDLWIISLTFRGVLTLEMACKGICTRHRAQKPVGGRYASGQKRCQICQIFIKWDGLWCPCCGYRLRTRPRNLKYKEKLRERAMRLEALRPRVKSAPVAKPH